MRQELTIEAVLSPGSKLLSEVTRLLNFGEGLPESFVWSNMEGSDEARIWMVLREPEARYRDLALELGRLPGVREVRLHGPGTNLLEALIRPTP